MVDRKLQVVDNFALFLIKVVYGLNKFSWNFIIHQNNCFKKIYHEFQMLIIQEIAIKEFT